MSRFDSVLDAYVKALEFHQFVKQEHLKFLHYFAGRLVSGLGISRDDVALGSDSRGESFDTLNSLNQHNEEYLQPLSSPSCWFTWIKFTLEKVGTPYSRLNSIGDEPLEFAVPFIIRSFPDRVEFEVAVLTDFIEKGQKFIFTPNGIGSNGADEYEALCDFLVKAMLGQVENIGWALKEEGLKNPVKLYTKPVEMPEESPLEGIYS